MGVYFVAVCHEKREIIDPGKIGGGANGEELVYSHAANVIAHAMLDRWFGCPVVIVGDSNHVETERIFSYKDVSAEALEMFNACRPRGVEPVQLNPYG